MAVRRRSSSAFLALACAAMAVSAPCRATVAPLCYGFLATPAPLPVGAGQAAILFSPRFGITSHQLHWFDPAGTEILFDRTDADGLFLLRPRVALTAGVHKLVYSDDCPDPSDPYETTLVFEAAPPPPTRLGDLTVGYDTLCPDDPSRKFYGDWPPLVGVGLELDPALAPYAAILRISIHDDVGSYRSTYWVADTNGTTHTFAGSMRLRCSGDSSSDMPPGEHTFVAEGTLVDGPSLEPATTTALLECPFCPDPAPPPIAPPPPRTQPAPSTVSAKETGFCAVGMRSRTSLPHTGALAVLAGVVVSLLRRKRRGQAAASLYRTPPRCPPA